MNGHTLARRKFFPGEHYFPSSRYSPPWIFSPCWKGLLPVMNIFIPISLPAVFATRPGGMGVTGAAFGKAVSTPQCRPHEHRRAAPKSTGALAREFIVCPRFHCEAACQSRFRAGVYRSGQNHHCAASQVAEPLSPRGQLTPAPCIQLRKSIFNEAVKKHASIYPDFKAVFSTVFFVE